MYINTGPILNASFIARKSFHHVSRSFATPGRSPVHATRQAVATSHPLGTSIAMSILNEGGSAVDAAICAAALLGVVEPHMTGVGGDCFAIVAEPGGSLHGINGSGRSPALGEFDKVRGEHGDVIPETSAHAVTVPGAVKAWEELHNRFGKLEWERLFVDAIHYAREGFPVAPRVAHDWRELTGKLALNEAAAASYLRDGSPPSAGRTWQLPKLADTLEKISRRGADCMYCGEIAADVVNAVRAAGGVLSEEDLDGVSADWVTPISVACAGGYRLHEIPPNGQGLAALVLVRLLEELDTASLDPHGLERAHLEAEAGRIAYAFRDAYIADPDHMEYDMETLLDDSHIKRLSALYDPGKRNDQICLPDPVGSDTVYLSIVDRDGMAVSFINSLFGGFGSGIVTPNTGIVLQNRGSGFNLREGHGNAYGPGKRPLHTIIPAMITRDGAITHCFGVMGGPYQAMGHGHVLSNLLYHGMDPQVALDNARIFWDGDGTLGCEPGISSSVVEGLRKKGHKVRHDALHGGGQIIAIDRQNGLLTAGSDPRKDGHAAGI